jgi:glutathione synthase/RimK-type ligase-like ATP-grasp enzyme
LLPRSADQRDDGRHVILLTAAELPDLHHDDAPLVAAFDAAGWRASPAIWSAPIPSGDLALVRSCWDYVDRHSEFLASIERLSRRMPLWNPLMTIRWNIDKRYLVELAAAGIGIPETEVVPRGNPRTLADVARVLGGGPMVVKPIVSGGGIDTWLAREGDETAWRRAVEARDLLVQPFVAEVLTGGEWSLIFFSDGYSHAVIKRAAEGEFRVQSDHGGRAEAAEPSTAIIAAAERALAAVPHPWCYARVDGIESAGSFLVMEVELIEPELFFMVLPAAAERLVSIVAG